MDSSMPGLPVHPSPTPRVYSNSSSIELWYHLNISSSFVPFFCLQSFPASGSFQMSQHFALGGQSIGVSASTSVLPMNIQDWFPLGSSGWNSLQAKRTLKSILQHHSSKTSILQHSPFFIVQFSHEHMTTGKTIALTRWIFVEKVMSLLFNMLSRLVITFLPKFLIMNMDKLCFGEYLEVAWGHLPSHSVTIYPLHISFSCSSRSEEKHLSTSY